MSRRTWYPGPGDLHLDAQGHEQPAVSSAAGSCPSIQFLTGVGITLGAAADPAAGIDPGQGYMEPGSRMQLQMIQDRKQIRRMTRRNW